MGTCSVVLAGRQVGTAVWERSGLRCRVKVRCRFEPDVLYRACMEVDGQQLPLGLLIPEGEHFVTDRLLPPGQSRLLEQAESVLCTIARTGLDGVGLPQDKPEPTPDPVLLQPLGILGEQLAPVPEGLITDPLLAEAAAARGDLLWYAPWLTMPARQGEDPMAPFFCLLQPAELGAEAWYLLRLENGTPVHPENRQKSHPMQDKLDGVMT